LREILGSSYLWLVRDQGDARYGKKRAGLEALGSSLCGGEGSSVKTSLVASERKNPLLVKLDQARRALAEARTIEETKRIRDVAKAAADLMKQQRLSKEAVRDATELRMRAERKLGEFLQENVGAHRPQKLSDGSTVLPRKRYEMPRSLGCERSESYASFWKRMSITTEALVKDDRKRSRVIRLLKRYREAAVTENHSTIMVL
jgi:hypothetical protein